MTFCGLTKALGINPEFPSVPSTTAPRRGASRPQAPHQPPRGCWQLRHNRNLRSASPSIRKTELPKERPDMASTSLRMGECGSTPTFTGIRWISACPLTVYGVLRGASERLGFEDIISETQVSPTAKASNSSSQTVIPSAGVQKWPYAMARMEKSWNNSPVLGTGGRSYHEPTLGAGIRCYAQISNEGKLAWRGPQHFSRELAAFPAKLSGRSFRSSRASRKRKHIVTSCHCPR